MFGKVTNEVRVPRNRHVEVGIVPRPSGSARAGEGGNSHGAARAKRHSTFRRLGGGVRDAAPVDRGAALRGSSRCTTARATGREGLGAKHAGRAGPAPPHARACASRPRLGERAPPRPSSGPKGRARIVLSRSSLRIVVAAPRTSSAFGRQGREYLLLFRRSRGLVATPAAAVDIRTTSAAGQLPFVLSGRRERRPLHGEKQGLTSSALGSGASDLRALQLDYPPGVFLQRASTQSTADGDSNDSARALRERVLRFGTRASRMAAARAPWRISSCKSRETRARRPRRRPGPPRPSYPLR